MNDNKFPTGDLGIFVYGSLMEKKALSELFDDFDQRTYRTKLKGYRRVFDLRADRRDVVDNRAAVLNLHSDENSTSNGLLITSVDPREYGIYARRETEYRHRILDQDNLSFYQERPDSLPEEIIVPCDGPSSSGMKPIPGYLKNCLKGAQQWGETFYRDFVETTTVASGESLADYLKQD